MDIFFTFSQFLSHFSNTFQLASCVRHNVCILPWILLQNNTQTGIDKQMDWAAGGYKKQRKHKRTVEVPTYFSG